MITTVVITGVMLALHGGQLRQGLHSVTVTLFASAWSDREGCKRWRGTSLDSTSDRRGIAEHMPEMPGSTAGSELFRGQLVDAMASLDRDRLVPVARRGRSGGVSSCLISVVAAAQLVCVCVCVCVDCSSSRSLICSHSVTCSPKDSVVCGAAPRHAVRPFSGFARQCPSLPLWLDNFSNGAHEH